MIPMKVWIITLIKSKKKSFVSFDLVENNGVNDNEGSDSSENSELIQENAPFRAEIQINRRNIEEKQNDKNGSRREARS